MSVGRSSIHRAGAPAAPPATTSAGDLLTRLRQISERLSRASTTPRPLSPLERLIELNRMLGQTAASGEKARPSR